MTKLNLNQKPEKLILLGLGDVLATIEDDPAGFGLSEGTYHSKRFETVDQISEMAETALTKLNPSEFLLFVSVDSNAMNHARLELYGRARLMGFKMTNLIHRSTIISPSVEISDNVYIGPGVVIGRSSKIASNSLVSCSSRT